jgi:hypothetical protein
MLRKASQVYAILCMGFVAFVSPALASFPGANGRLAVEGEKDTLSSELPTGGTELELLPHEINAAAYSPDGSKLALVAGFSTLPGTGTEAGEEGAGIYVMPAGGGSPTRLSPNYLEGGDPSSVSWSPNGSQIVYGFQ